MNESSRSVYEYSVILSRIFLVTVSLLTCFNNGNLCHGSTSMESYEIYTPPDLITWWHCEGENDMLPQEIHNFIIEYIFLKTEEGKKRLSELFKDGEYNPLSEKEIEYFHKLSREIKKEIEECPPSFNVFIRVRTSPK